jgi:hypothetical protein
MELFFTFLLLIGIYIFLVFIGIRLIVPFMGFGKFTLPEKTPQIILQKVQELDSSAHSQEEYLQGVYDFVTSRWHAGRLNTILYAPLAFRTNLETIWNQPGYAHCNTQNYLLFILLANSRYFEAGDIKPRCVFFNFFIHQYLQIRVNNSFIDADPAGASIRGAKLGTKIEFFG